MPKSISAFRFKVTDSIGAAGAEDDDFLAGCFVDTGVLNLLSDVGHELRRDVYQDAVSWAIRV